MKISKAYFNRFKKAFLGWQRKLGLTQYDVMFFHEPLEKKKIAKIVVNELGKVADVFLTTELNGRDVEVDDGPEARAKHEVLHLLLYRLVWLGGARYIENDDLKEEWEALVRKLEKVL